MQPSPEAVPACVGIIMDGNRRFAKERGLAAVRGHEHGYDKLKEVLEWVKARGIRDLVVYAFSTENWGRPPEEVAYLLRLLGEAFAAGSKDMRELVERGIALRFVGDRSRFDPAMQETLAEAERATAAGTWRLWACLSYGGRAEILHAARELAASGAEATEENFAKHLWTAGMPDPDLIIRTSGEKRLSGFLPWQGVYSELCFVDTYWPALTEAEFDRILADYASRERRRGK
ncbi:MAG: di-trans,poly-cis-decaprenylcistransferase [Patescibacteria group bacterium]|nr:di-trans,poly-cis-decaprenylcistransferase [Patescibacteria group bacterium]MDE1944131.1 di-trans,poly-cis-decaprenylcistransferase [Patescibacteria group bacterium]MDE1944752.1 di-trans,poly-cis-decaprenylcistransferase [Patescibacteria group bacterium]MDE2057962.1 di-trans,poly-cis-decaprenylcistransferase [Patescibacteria group bacterium]